MSDDKFIPGLYAKRPKEGAPEFVIANISIKLADFAQFLRDLKQSEPDAEWINAQLKMSRAGKFYIERDTWKRDQSQQQPQKPDDSVPF